MRIPRYQYKNDLICSVCGEVITVIQSDGRKTKLFKIVEKECPKCNKKRKFIVIQDIEVARQVLSFKQEMTITESIVYNLIKKEDEKKKIK